MVERFLFLFIYLFFFFFSKDFLKKFFFEGKKKKIEPEKEKDHMKENMV